MRSHTRRWLLPLLLLCTGCAAAPEARTSRPAEVTPHATAFPAADALFHGDPRWLGGDAAVSVELDGERTLWLFGDSFVSAARHAERGGDGGEAGPGGRRGATMVRNSVAIQTGRDPESAQMHFVVSEPPASFFPEEGARWYWPQHGVLLEGELTLFLYSLIHDPGDPLGFRYDGWSVLRVHNPEAAPEEWQMRRLEPPDTAPIEMVGVSVLVDTRHVYAYGVREPGDHAIYVLRWARQAFIAGDLGGPAVWAGPSRGWTRGPPRPLAGAGQTEFSVIPAPRGGYLLSQTLGFGSSVLALRFASAPEGPFGEPVEVHRPAEYGRDGILIYGARAHPELLGEGLLVTYNVNTLDAAALMDDLTIYFPRFVKVDL